LESRFQPAGSTGLTFTVTKKEATVIGVAVRGACCLGVSSRGRDSRRRKVVLFNFCGVLDIGSEINH